MSQYVLWLRFRRVEKENWTVGRICPRLSRQFFRVGLLCWGCRVWQSTRGMVAEMAGIYFLTVCKLGVQDQGISRVGSFGGLSPWHADDLLSVSHGLSLWVCLCLIACTVTHHIGTEPILMTSFYLHVLLKHLPFQSSHTGRYWGLGCQHMNFQGIQCCSQQWTKNIKFQELSSHSIETTVFFVFCPSPSWSGSWAWDGCPRGFSTWEDPAA